MPIKKKKQYVNNGELYEEIEGFYKLEEISEKLHFMFFEMTNHIINRSRFIRYTPERREDMISDAYLKCLNVIAGKKFNLERKNPFSYFTTVIRNSFKDSAGSEKKQVLIKEKLFDKFVSKNNKPLIKEDV